MYTLDRPYTLESLYTLKRMNTMDSLYTLDRINTLENLYTHWTVCIPVSYTTLTLPTNSLV